MVTRYYAFLGPGNPQLVGRAKARWAAIALELSDKRWCEVLDTYLLMVIASKT